MSQNLSSATVVIATEGIFYFLEDYSPGSPVAMFGILPHEQKMSVLNLVLRKSADITKPIKSKERLIFHIGFRRFSACPVFSQHTNGNKHKVGFCLVMIYI